MIMLDPRIPSFADMKFARNVSLKLNRKTFTQEELGLYYVLAAMEENSDFLRRKTIPPFIPVLNIMAEHGPFDNKEENDQFKSAQRNFINKRANARLVYAKGSSHNIPQDQPEFVISEILNFNQHNPRYS